MNFKFILILLIIFGIILYQTFKKSRQSYTYYFIQQREDTCHLCSWYNYNILQKLRSRIDDPVINSQNLSKYAKSHDKYYWFVLDSLICIAWHNLLVSTSSDNPVSKKYPLLKQFSKLIAKQGITVPHIYLDKDKTTNIYDHYGLIGMGLFYTLASTCMNYSDIEHFKITIPWTGIKKKLSQLIELPDLTINFPYFVDQTGSYIYHLKSEKFKPFKGKKKEISQYYKSDISQIHKRAETVYKNIKCYHYLVRLSSDHQIDLYLPITCDQTSQKKLFGYQVLNKTGVGIRNPLNKNETLIIYSSNILYATFFLMGVAPNNKSIHTQHVLYPYVQEMNRASAENDPLKLNMWGTNNPYFTKEYLFQYHLANILQQDKKLFNLLVDLIKQCPLPIWQIYQQMGDYYNQFGIPFNQTDYQLFILGSEQMMAYLISILIWVLWNGCLSVKCLSECLQVPLIMAHFLWIRLEFSFSQKINGYGLLDALKIIHHKFDQLDLDDYGLRYREFVSVCSHSYVISYEKDLIHMQQQSAGKNIKNWELFQQLPAIIDSWNGEHLGKYVFYASPN